VRVEREAAQDDPRAEQPAGDGQERDLHEALLDERELEDVEQPRREYRE
jgi:hypothetical protein